MLHTQCAPAGLFANSAGAPAHNVAAQLDCRRIAQASVRAVAAAHRESTMLNEDKAMQAQATLHHAYFLGLQLMVASRESVAVVGEWIFRLFRQQHEDHFLASFEKLELDGLPDAVACARYHVLSNSIGGVPVEYVEESEKKAWVRFRYPRWMFAGPTLCGMPVEASRGFLRGWYAHNGVSLGNPRLGFVCVSEDMTGQFGFCGYFKEYEHELNDDARLRFAFDEYPPAFVAASQLQPPTALWSPERLAKANRNYAVAYVKNAVLKLIEVVGRERGRELACLAARLIGLQYYQQLAELVGARDGDYQDTADFLAVMFRGMGDEATIRVDADKRRSVIGHQGLRIVRGLDASDRDDLLTCWMELWLGTIHSHQTLKHAEVLVLEEGLQWVIEDK
jgi:hypothetical protein